MWECLQDQGLSNLQRLLEKEKPLLRQLLLNTASSQQCHKITKRSETAIRDSLNFCSGFCTLNRANAGKNIPHFKPPWEKDFLGQRNLCCSEVLLVGTSKQIQIISSVEKSREIPTENLRVCACHPGTASMLPLPPPAMPLYIGLLGGEFWYSEGSNHLWKGTRQRHWSVFKTKQRINILVQFSTWLINGIQQLYPAHSPSAKYCRKDVEEHSWILKSLQEGGKKQHSSNQAKQHFFCSSWRAAGRKRCLLTWMELLVPTDLLIHWRHAPAVTTARAMQASFSFSTWVNYPSRKKKMGPKT